MMEARGDEYIIILRVIIERRLFVEKGTGLWQIKENSAPSSQLPLHGPPTMPTKRSCLSEYPTQPNCSGLSLYQRKLSSRSDSYRTTGLIPLLPLCTHTLTAHIHGRWQEDRPWLTDINRFAGSLLAFWGHLLPFRGTSHTHLRDPHERREWEGGAGARFITYGGAAPFPPFSGRFDTRKAKGRRRKAAAIYMRQRMLLIVRVTVAAILAQTPPRFRRTSSPPNVCIISSNVLV